MNKAKLSEKFGCLIVLMVPVLILTFFGIISSIFNDIVAAFVLIFVLLVIVMYFSQGMKTISSEERTRARKIYNIILWLLMIAFIFYGVPRILFHFLGIGIVKAYVSLIFGLFIAIFVWSAIDSFRRR